MLVFTLSVFSQFLKVLFCIKTGSIKGAVVGQRLLNALITTETEMDFITCIKNCVRRSRCRSVNYMERFLLCELNYKNTSDRDTFLIKTAGTVYSESWETDKLLSKACRENACSIKNQCLENDNGQAFCAVSDCGLPNTENTIYDLTNGIGEYSKVTYSCAENSYMEVQSRIGCQNNGEWSPSRFECIQGCQAGWQHFNGSCYKASESFMNFSNAKDYCEERGAYLADVLSEEENDFIWRLQIWSPILLGGIYDIHNQRWMWVSSNVTFFGNGADKYANWDRGQPAWNVMEDCMGLFYSTMWHNWECYRIRPFVCKKNTQI